MITLGLALLALGGGMLAGMLWRPPRDDRAGAWLLFAVFVVLGLGLAALLAGQSIYVPIDRPRSSTGLAPIAGAPLWLRIDDAHGVAERSRR